MRFFTIVISLAMGCGAASPIGKKETSIHSPQSAANRDTESENSISETSSPEDLVGKSDQRQVENDQSQSKTNEGTESNLKFVQRPQWGHSKYASAPQIEVIQFSFPEEFDASDLKCKFHIKNETEDWILERTISEIQIRDPSTPKERICEAKIYGLKPDTTYKITLQIEAHDHQQLYSEIISIQTSPVPEIFPQIEVRKSAVERMEPGLTLFNLIRWVNDKPDTDFGAIVAIDAAGVIRWSYLAPHLIFIVRQLDNGNLLYGYGNRTDGLIEIDLSGTLVHKWDASRLQRTVALGAIPVAVESLHHDVIPTHNGTFLALSTTTHEIRSYYDPGYHPRKRIEKATLVGDVVVEFTPEGKVLKRYSLLELLDPRRIGYGSLHNFWDSRGYEFIEEGTFDWSHSNSVTLDPQDGNIIVSVRHQDAVIKIDRKTGGLIWILGTPKGWRGIHQDKLLKPAGGLKWPFHQHAVAVTPQGTLLMFDNGNYQAVPFDKMTDATENYSRVAEFRVNEKDRKVEQVWEYAGHLNARFYSTFLCDVDWLKETGNVLITNGGEIRDEKGHRTDAAPGDQQWAEIFEVTYGEDPEKIFDVKIDSPPDQQEIGWSIYRAERIRNFFKTQKIETY